MHTYWEGGIKDFSKWEGGWGGGGGARRGDYLKREDKYPLRTLNYFSNLNHNYFWWRKLYRTKSLEDENFVKCFIITTHSSRKSQCDML